jgi:hypothetical protein
MLVISVMAILSLVAVLVSLSDSTSIAFFSQPKPGSPNVVKNFHEDVKATLDASSFFLSGGGTLGPIEYQSPNRTKDLSTSDEVIVIGKTSYLELGKTGYGELSRAQWGEGPLTSELNNLFGPRSVKFVLQQLIRLKSVKRVAGGFVARQVVSAAHISPGAPGQALIFWSVGTRNGFVVGFNQTAHGIFPSYAFVKKTHRFSPVTVKVLRSEPVTYSSIGKIAKIVAPPKDKTVQLIPCKNGDTADYGIDGYVCGTLGT